ncbi:hypothetical protein GX865_02715 [Candidatus Saccharibacteria bacterium]|jgi:Zn-dependent protease with chaperone function|nr:hypothetical protein [Candidatus Saccharibacteria bacterium]
MNSSDSVRTIKAITVYVGQKALKTSLSIAIIALSILLVAIWLLANSISNWWWVLLLPIVAVTFMLSIAYSFVRFLLLKVYPYQFTKEQSNALRAFLDKLTKLNETRSTPMFLIVIKTIWEILRHKEAITIKRTIEQSKSMKPDFERLTSFFTQNYN